ncbi:AmmeMemoRadiSam system protein A [Myxococcota bacterium]|nr:AmmeMemoRadiSam system protein A [Myxococcota bacterium]MBU1382326.1 AmmeMemoRadiSam system protein A [Myxococcota bacterium]MBU1498442.1 AmmeMemoRadiSam system protein A [Myxococcota bacterium]
MEKETALSVEDKAFLIKVVRKAISSKFAGGYSKKEARSSVISEKLNAPCGVFVTLKKHGDLRGCIGNFRSQTPLIDNIYNMALAAAFEDNRFEPVTEDELSDIQIEISVLSELFPVKPDEIEIGKHGLYLTFRHFGGVFLPQVPVEWGWDLQEYLDELCLKAHLPPGTHLHKEAVLEAFTADVFHEE